MGRNPSGAIDSTFTTATQPVLHNCANSLDCPVKYGTWTSRCWETPVLLDRNDEYSLTGTYRNTACNSQA
jgi:hypothetical protein